MNIPEIIKQFAGPIDIVDVIICLAGLMLFSIWLVKTSWGRRALADSVPRRNNMPAYLPFIPLFIWLAIVLLAVSITEKLLPDLPDWQSVFVDNLILCISAIVTMVVIIFLAQVSFVRRLKGFGFNVKTIGRDFFAGVVNLISIWPFVMLAIILTMYLGQLIWGQDFQMQQHQGLQSITAYPQLPVRVLIIITVVAVVPVFEEMLFRGLFQTMIRSFLARPQFRKRGAGWWPVSARASNRAWLSIVISSGIFAIVHANTGHWPALFVLSMCMGYAYEKSGSLFRPIFIHSLFNTTSIIAALYGG